MKNKPLVITDDATSIAELRRAYKTIEGMGFTKHAQLKTFEVRLWLNENECENFEFETKEKAIACLKKAKGTYTDGWMHPLIDGRIVANHEPIYMADL